MNNKRNKEFQERFKTKT